MHIRFILKLKEREGRKLALKQRTPYELVGVTVESLSSLKSEEGVLLNWRKIMTLKEPQVAPCCLL